MSKAPWVKWYAEKFLHGIIGMTAEEIGVYSLLLNMIYETGGPVKEDLERLAARCRMRPTSFRKVLDSLEENGKLLRADGVISNPRAEKELETRAKVVEKWRENFSGGKGKKEGKDNENNTSTPPSAEPPEKPHRGVEKESVEKDKERKRAVAPPQPRAAPRTRGSRIPQDWKLTPELLLYARSKGLTDKESKNEAEKFSSYWRGVAGDKGVKLDWDATWQSWIMRTAERLGRNPVEQQQSAGGPADYSREEWVKIIEIWRVTSNWHPMHGPAPGSAGCLVLKDLL